MKSIDEIKLLKPEQAGYILGVTKRTVLRYCQEGDLPYYRIGNQYRFSMKDVLKFRKKINKFSNS